MTTTRKLWIGLGLLLSSTFAVLLFVGSEIYRLAPPLPEQVVSASGETLFTRDDLDTGRQVWQSMGGMQVGSIWGHGALIAPDWSADWLHRESEALLNLWSQQQFQSPYAELSASDQEVLKVRLRQDLRPNTYDATTQTITLSDDRVAAIKQIIPHYVSLFGADPETAKLRETYAMKDGSVAAARCPHSFSGPPGRR
jgi:nitric oxide reductase subunit B